MNFGPFDCFEGKHVGPTRLGVGLEPRLRCLHRRPSFHVEQQQKGPVLSLSLLFLFRFSFSSFLVGPTGICFGL